MRLALYQPDIPQNTGTILRTCACLRIPVDVIGPTGFDMSDRALRRAGMDYLAHVSVTRHVDWSAFIFSRGAAAPGRLVLLTAKGEETVPSFAFTPQDVILLGRESAGVPADVAAAADARVRIPIVPGLRSLNIAIAAALALGEALRQTNGYPAGNAAPQ